MDKLTLVLAILAVSAFAVYRIYVIIMGIAKLFVYAPQDEETKRRLRLMKETEARNNERIRKWSENR